MTKAEELKILEAIEELILEAGPDSYIRRTFAGIPEICKQNIESDFWISPVEELDEERERHMKADVEHGNRLLNVERERDILRQAVENKDAEIATLNHLLDSMRKTADEWEQNAHDAGEMYCGLEAECAELSAEVRKLKAEIVRMRMERMTEDDMAELYDTTMKGAKNNG